MTTTPRGRLHRLDEWLKLKPEQQGLVLYMEEAHDGSELKGQVNPYAPGSKEHDEFKRGEQRGVLIAQDSEE